MGRGCRGTPPLRPGPSAPCVPVRFHTGDHVRMRGPLKSPSKSHSFLELKGGRGARPLHVLGVLVPALK